MTYCYQRIIDRIVQQVRQEAAHQVIDPQRDDHGAWIAANYGMASCDHTASGGALARAVAALLADGSGLEHDAMLFTRVQAGIAFMDRWQRGTGLIDLPKVDFDSPPDTAFLVQVLCPVLELARTKRQQGDEQAVVIDEALSPFLERAASGVVGRGFRTPNHRWVVCSALAQAMAMFPDIDAMAYVESILAETIDINADGDYSERSNGIYNSVSNRALRLMADYLDKPALLEPVRANLDLMLYMFHPDGTVVTTGSTRQDRGARMTPGQLADSYFDMAMRDGNGRWAAMADQLAAADEQTKIWPLQPFIAHPAYRDEALPREAVSNRYRRLFPASGVWRVREDRLSATATAQHESALALRYGAIDLAAVRVRGNYFHVACFTAGQIEPTSGGVRMLHRGNRQSPPGWDLPLGRAVEFDNPHQGYYQLASDGTRDRWPLPPLDMELAIARVDHGFDLHVATSGGVDRIPMVIEFEFATPGHWEALGAAMPATANQMVVLPTGHGVFHCGADAIRIGPGCDAHRCLNEGAIARSAKGFRVMVPLVTPVRHTIELRCGAWSWADRDLRLPGDAPMIDAQAPLGV